MSGPDEAHDRRHMAAALALAARGLGRTAPNPAVGCVVLDAAGRVAGRGWTQPGGRPHAEDRALAQAGAATGGGTVYVTLEPCAHNRPGGNCADLLVRARPARVVVAARDPDPRTNGQGLARLRAAGIAVTEGVCGAAARDLNRGFFLRVEAGRPLVTLKLATTLDGRIATHHGESQWITGEAARTHAHRLRAEHDAVLVGAMTALTDNPRLTVRAPGLEDRRPLRVVLDGRLRLPLTHHLVAEARRHPTLLICLAGAETARLSALLSAGVEVAELPAGPGGAVPLGPALTLLASRGVTRLLCEGGGRLAAALLRDGFVDRLAWITAAVVMGGDGLPAAMPLGVQRLAQAPRFRVVARTQLGDDWLIEAEPARDR